MQLLLLLLGLLLVTTCWALAAPPLSGPDEGAHLIKAVSVVRGQLIGQPGNKSVMRRVRTPSAYSSIGVYPPCYARHPTPTADCQRPLAATAGPPASAQTYVIRYPPLFYGFAGWPSLILPPRPATYAVRVAAALPTVVLLALALFVARRSRGAVLGVLIAMTPTVGYLAAVSNPNALEIAAAVCLWSCGVALLRGEARRWPRHAFGVAGLVLPLVRGMSPLWLVVILAVLLLLDRRVALRLVRGDRLLRRWLWVDLTALVVGTGYVVIAKSLEVLRPAVGVHLSGVAALRHSAARIPQWAGEAVAGSGWLTSPVPPITFGVWAVALVALIVSCRDRRWRGVACGLLVAAFVGAVLIEAPRLPVYGDGWRGRYLLPLLVGVPIVLGAPMREAVARRAWVTRLLVSGLIVAQVAFFWQELRSSMVGAGGSRLLRHPAWSPPVSGWLLLVGFAVGLIVTALVALRPSRTNSLMSEKGGHGAARPALS